YVAYSKALAVISTSKRTVSVICTLAGTLKRVGSKARDGGGFQRLVEVTTDDSIYPRELHVKKNPVEPFQGSKDVGIEPRPDPNRLEAKHLLNIESAEPRLTTLLQASPRSNTAPLQ